VRCTENAAHNFGQKHLKVWAASVDEGLVTLPYGSDEPFEFLDGEFEKNGPATSRCSRRGIAARLSSVEPRFATHQHLSQPIENM